MVITNSAFADNTNTDILFTSEKGGTIYCASSSLTVENCIFSGGISDKGGSIYFSSSLVSFARSKLSFCTFSNNIAREEGGAVHHASLSVASSLTIDNCTFIANTAGGEGGAIYHDASSLTLNSSAIAYNQGETALTMSSGTIERCTIVNNLPALESEEDTPQDGIAVTAALLMSGSNLFGHSRYDLYNDSETDISATGNYWGTIDSSEIDRKIFDFLDNTEKGEVLYEPLLSDISHDAPEIPEEPTTTTSSIPGGTSTTSIPDDNTSSTTATAVEGTQITVDFGASPTSGSAPLQVQFKNLTESKTVISSYLWDFGDGSFSSESEPVHSYAKKGTYGVQLTAYATDGTSAEVFKENYIEVEQSVLPQVAFWTIIILLLFIVLL